MTLIWIALGAFVVLVAYALGRDHERIQRRHEDAAARVAAEQERARFDELQHRGCSQREIEQREALKRRDRAIRDMRKQEESDPLEVLFALPEIVPDHEQTA